MLRELRPCVFHPFHVQLPGRTLGWLLHPVSFWWPWRLLSHVATIFTPSSVDVGVGERQDTGDEDPGDTVTSGGRLSVESVSHCFLFWGSGAGGIEQCECKCCCAGDGWTDLLRDSLHLHRGQGRTGEKKQRRAWRELAPANGGFAPQTVGPMFGGSGTDAEGGQPQRTGVVRRTSGCRAVHGRARQGRLGETKLTPR